MTTVNSNAPDRPKGIRRYEPLAPAAGALVAGILAGEYLGGSMALWCAAAVAAAGVWILLACPYGPVPGRRGRPRALLVPLLLVMLAAGAARYRAGIDPPPDDVARLVPEGSRIGTVEGVVVRSPHPGRPPTDVFLPSTPYYLRTKFILEAERAEVEGRWYPARGRVYVSIREPMLDGGSVAGCSAAAFPGRREAGRSSVRGGLGRPPRGSHGTACSEHRTREGGPGIPQLGDRARITGRLMRPLPRANPGTFDVATYFRRQGVRACLSTDHWEAARVVEPAAEPFRWAVGAMGRWAVRRFRAMRSPAGRAVASAIVLGRRDLLRFDAGQAETEDIERAFIVTGTAHFLAVSGFSVGLAAGVVLLLARLLGLGPKPTAVLVAVAVGAYAMMTELRPPVVRAAVLVWLLCLAWATGRERMRLNALAAAVLVILLIRPGDLFTTSFQLSFAVVLGMFYLAGKVEAVLFRRAGDPLEDDEEPAPGSFRLPSYARRTVTLSLAAALVAVPLVANRFHLVSWLAPVASVLLAPLVFLLIAGSMALVVLGAPAPWLGDLLAAVPDGMARAVTGVVSALARVPGGHFYTPGFSSGWLLVTYGLLAAWVWRERLRLPIGRNVPRGGSPDPPRNPDTPSTGGQRPVTGEGVILTRRRLALAVLAAAAVFLWTAGHPAPDGVRATFVAVGSGNTTLVELPCGRTLLYDAGSSLSYARAAEGTTAPVLWSRGVGRIDAVFISHAHFDHFKDVLPLVDRFGIRRVFVPPTFLRRRLSVDDAVVEALLARGVRVTYFGAGDRLAGTGATRVRGVWPRGAASQTDDINDGSLVLSVGPVHGTRFSAGKGAVEEGEGRLLLTGDIEPPAISGLIAAEPDLRAGAVLWPHHGHAPEAARELLRHTGARVAVISAARGWNPRPLPAWLADDGVTCYHAGRHGTVTVELGDDGVQAETFRTPTGREQAL